jgi:sarcosine oxidase subunit beta
MRRLAAALHVEAPPAAPLGRHHGHDTDGSPFICRTPVDNLFLNGGWCYQGFKATPASGWTFAHTIAHDDEHPLSRCYSLDRFREGAEMDEHGHGNWAYKQ